MVTYKIHQLTDYINWLYFFHAWGFQPKFAAIAEVHACAACYRRWRCRFPLTEQPKAVEAIKLYEDAVQLLRELDLRFTVKGTFRLFEAYADGDNLLLDGTVFPLLRQQQANSEDAPNLCLSDFVRPLEGGVADTVGAFATTVDGAMEQLFADDPYKRMLVQTLADRLAEAAAERMHEEVRRVHWGYAKDEHLTMQQLHIEAFQGIRPAVGYPSLPDQSVNFLLNDLLGMEEIGIALTENGMMIPHASVSGLMFAHPKAQYFAVGKIGDDQLADYATRRGLPVEEMRRFLGANLQ